MVTIRIWLKEIRESKKLSQKEVAERAEITTQHYNYIENGKRDPHQRTAKKIAKICDFDWRLFYPDEDVHIAIGM